MPKRYDGGSRPTDNNYLATNGNVIDILPGGKFRVGIAGMAQEVTCTLSGRMRANRITIVRGDYVDIDVSLYDLTKGRITYRRSGARAA